MLIPITKISIAQMIITALLTMVKKKKNADIQMLPPEIAFQVVLKHGQHAQHVQPRLRFTGLDSGEAGLER